MSIERPELALLARPERASPVPISRSSKRAVRGYTLQKLNIIQAIEVFILFLSSRFLLLVATDGAEVPLHHPCISPALDDDVFKGFTGIKPPSNHFSLQQLC